MTTTVVKTLGPGGDYTSLDAWNDGPPGHNLVTAAIIWEGQCLPGFNPAGGSGTLLTISGSTSDSAHYKHLTTAPGAGFSDNASAQTNPLRFDSSMGVGLSANGYHTPTIAVSEAYARITKLQIENQGSNSEPAVSVTGTNVQIDGCILEGSAPPSVLEISGSNPVVTNTLILSRASSPTSVIALSGVVGGTFVNDTVAVVSDKAPSSSNLLKLTYSTSIVAKNCAFFGGSLVNNGNITYTTCFNDQSSPPTGVTQVAYDTTTGSGFEATTDSARDFRIQKTSALKDSGTTDSLDAGVDIVGTARPAAAAYDVGAWEFALIPIVFSSPADGRIVQSASGVGSVTVTGNYIGTPTHLRAKLIHDADGTVVTGFDWAEVVTTPSGGTFTFTLTNIPKAASWYKVVVDFSNDSTQTATSGKVGVGALIGFTGQSNANRMFTTAAPGITPSPYVRQYVGSWDASSISSPIAALGNALVASYGTVVGLIDTAVDGTTIDSWNPTGSATNYTSALAVFNALGGKLSAMVWVQGEADWDGTTGASYLTQLGQVLDTGFRTALGQPTLPVLVVALGSNKAAGTFATYDEVKTAQYAYAAGNPHNYIIERADVELDPGDGTHHTTAGWIVLAGRYAQAINVAKGRASEYRGPSISGVLKVDAVTYDVALVNHSGNDFNPDTGITGFSVVDPGAGNAAIAITQAVRNSSTRIRLTLATAPVSLPKVSFLLGHAPDISNLAEDNSLLTLPVEYDPGTVAIVPGTTVTLTLTSDGSTPAANLTGLKWAFFDQATPDVLSVPASQGLAGSTDASGVLTLAVTTSLPVGGVGWLTISDSDGTTSQSPAESAFSGPVLVS